MQNCLNYIFVYCLIILGCDGLWGSFWANVLDLYSEKGNVIGFTTFLSGFGKF